MSKKADMGLIGLAVMGENLALNMERNGYTVAVFNRSVEKVDAFVAGRGAGKKFIGCHSLQELAENLEGGLMAIPLTQFAAANTAFMNDVSPESAFAQLVQTFGRKEDVFVGISTSGNSKNIVKALMAAKARGVRTICLTGKTGGRCKDLCDICICVALVFLV